MRKCSECQVFIEDNQVVCYRCGTIQVELPKRSMLEDGTVTLEEYLEDIEGKLELLEREKKATADAVKAFLGSRAAILGFVFVAVFMGSYMILDAYSAVEGACFGLIFIESAVVTLMLSVLYAGDLLEKYSRKRVYSGNMARLHQQLEEERKWATSSKITEEYGRP